MIAKGNTHGSGGQLAAYLVAGKDGERAELYQLRGFDGFDLKEAFRVVGLMAQGTRCDKPFFHVQVRNPEGEELTRAQWERVADRIESKLGYSGQPRAITFHTDEKTGHEHMHVAFSRIDEDTLKIKPLPFFKLRLKEVCRELENELDLTRVTNERSRPEIMAPSREEQEQSRRLGTDDRAIRGAIRDAFDRADSGKAFAAALSEQGLTLAQGERRDFIVVDQQGGIHTLGKRLLGVTAAATRTRLGDLERQGLPTVEEVRAHLPVREQVPAIEDRTPPRTDAGAIQPRSYDALQATHDAVAAEARAAKEAEPVRSPAEAWAAAASGVTVRDAELAAKANKPPRKAPELKGANADIRMSAALSQDTGEFVEGLAFRKLKLARVTEADIAARNEALRRIDPALLQGKGDAWMMQTGGASALSPDHYESAQRSYDAWKELAQRVYPFGDYVSYVQKQWAERRETWLQQQQEDPQPAVVAPDAKVELPPLPRRARSGDLVAVNEWGSVYSLLPYNTGKDWPALKEFVATIDATGLKDVAETRAAQIAVREARLAAEREERRQERAARIAELPDIQQLRMAWGLAEKPADIVASIEAKGFLVARTSFEDAGTSQHTHKTLRSYSPDYSAPTYAEGELLAVSARGRVYRLDGVTLDDPEAMTRLAAIDTTPLLTLDQAKQSAGCFREPEPEPAPQRDPPQTGSGLNLDAFTGMALGSVAGKVGGVVEGIADFLFGGVGHRPIPTAPVLRKEVAPMDAERKRIHRQMGMTRPEEAVSDPNFKELARTYTLGVRPEIVEAMRRQVEQAKAREREDRERER